MVCIFFFFFSSRRRHTRSDRDWSSDVCSSDLPEKLSDYAKAYGIGPGWLFLTGQPDNVELLRQKLGYVDPNPEVDKDKSLHSGMLRYGNEPSSLWASCQGGAKPEWIAETISWV